MYHTHGRFPAIGLGEEFRAALHHDEEEIRRISLSDELYVCGKALEIGSPHQLGETVLAHALEELQMADLGKITCTHRELRWLDVDQANA